MRRAWNFKDLTDQKFGRLTVKSRVENKNNRATWQCLCECGKNTIARGHDLLRNRIKSCGCLNKELRTKHGMSDTLTYSVWEGIIQRCNNPNYDCYHNYGGRGIKVCNKWLKFENFYEDMGERPTGLTIERINNMDGYYKENCKWATYTEQSRNKRSLKNKTGTIGVSWCKNGKKYRARIKVNKKEIHLGHYSELEDAVRARKNAEIKYWNKGETI